MEHKLPHRSSSTCPHPASAPTHLLSLRRGRSRVPHQQRRLHGGQLPKQLRAQRRCRGCGPVLLRHLLQRLHLQREPAAGCPAWLACWCLVWLRRFADKAGKEGISFNGCTFNMLLACYEGGTNGGRRIKGCTCCPQLNCPLQGNSADVFGNDVYMESWVATPAYFNPFPTTARALACAAAGRRGMACLWHIYF